jgi:hypothetical protein
MLRDDEEGRDPRCARARCGTADVLETFEGRRHINISILLRRVVMLAMFGRVLVANNTAAAVA